MKKRVYDFERVMMKAEGHVRSFGDLGMYDGSCCAVCCRTAGGRDFF